MKSEIKTISSVRKEATVTIEKDTMQSEEATILRSFARDIKIAGFRKGKVPVSLIKSRYAKELDEQIDKTLASKTFDDVVKENNWDVFSLVKFDTKNLENGDKEICFTVDLKPSIELMDYRNIDIEDPEISVTAEEIDAAIDQIRGQHADYNEVKRPVQKGDFVRLQYIGTLVDGTPAINIVPKSPIWAEQKNTWEEAAASEDSPGIRAIIDGIVGMEIDQEKDVSMDFAADFEIPELQGKTVSYHMKIFEIREKILPELDEAFFKKIKVQDLEDFRKRISEDIKIRKTQEQRFEQREHIVQAMIDKSAFEIPESAADYEQVHLIRSFVERQIHEGMTEEMIQGNKNKLYEDTKELSRDRAKVNFILEKIAENEKITIAENEMSQMIVQEAAMLRVSPDQLVNELKNNRERIQELQRRALFGKTLDFILLENLKRISPEAVSDTEKVSKIDLEDIKETENCY